MFLALKTNIHYRCDQVIHSITHASEASTSFHILAVFYNGFLIFHAAIAIPVKSSRALVKTLQGWR